MRHFVIFIYIISFSVGIAATLLFFIVYLKYKIQIIKSYLIFLFLFTFYIIIAFFSTYSATIINNNNEYHFIFIYTMYFIWLGLFVYYMPLFIHQLLGLGFSGFKKYVFIFLTSIIYIMLVIPFLTNNKLLVINNILKFELNVIATPSLIPIIFYILYLLWYYKTKIENEVNKKILNSIFFLSILFLPGLLLDFIHLKTQLDWKILPLGFTFSSIYYLSWNIISIIYVIQYFITKINILPSVRIPESFVKEFLISEKEFEIISLILKGYSNQEIADHLFIATQTVKNHIYNIYQKMKIKSRTELINSIAQFF